MSLLQGSYNSKILHELCVWLFFDTAWCVFSNDCDYLLRKIYRYKSSTSFVQYQA